MDLGHSYFSLIITSILLSHDVFVSLSVISILCTTFSIFLFPQHPQSRGQTNAIFTEASLDFGTIFHLSFHTLQSSKLGRDHSSYIFFSLTPSYSVTAIIFPSTALRTLAGVPRRQWVRCCGVVVLRCWGPQRKFGTHC